MARGTTLANLRALLKSELGDTQETNDFVDAEYNRLLATEQKNYANMFDWPFLQHRWDISCVAGTRFVALPTSDILSLTVSPNFERPVLAERYFNTKYWKLDYGITSVQYNWRNSDLAEALDPIQRWMLVGNVNETSPYTNKIEVWPIPVTAQTVRLTGQRDLKALLSDSDTADLDDLLLVYTVAANRLLLRGQSNAQMKLAQAERHLAKLRAGYPTSEEPIVLGRRSSYERDLRRITPLVVVH